MKRLRDRLDLAGVPGAPPGMEDRAGDGENHRAGTGLRLMRAAAVGLKPVPTSLATFLRKLVPTSRDCAVAFAAPFVAKLMMPSSHHVRSSSFYPGILAGEGIAKAPAHSDSKEETA